MPPRFSDHPLTGRTNELARARDALSDGGSLVVEGPGGAGRSRLWEAACDLARAEGSRVVAAVATEATRTIALAPFAGLVPRSRPSDPTLLLQGVVDEIRARGSSVGLVLAVDDAHLLDATSLALLTHALREAGCTLLLTRADDTETPNGLQPVLDHRRVSRLPLAPLARDDCAELTRHALGEVGQDVLDELWRVTQGNPLMLRELLAEGSDFVGRDDEGRWRVVGDLSGSRLRDLVRRRVGTLPPALHRSLDVLAVGAPVSYDVLVRAIGAEQFSALHDAGFAETVRSDEGPVVRAAHPLYGPVYAGQAGEARRRRAKALLVEAARLAPGSTDPLRVAHWHRDSG